MAELGALDLRSLLARQSCLTIRRRNVQQLIPLVPSFRLLARHDPLPALHVELDPILRLAPSDECERLSVISTPQAALNEGFIRNWRFLRLGERLERLPVP